ncbi:hypothetical protein V1264_006562 [Littorina saxatilis]|uniref:Uncharacterized protein n=1 Tax=Littorina saxatilis TaxID=31220 RepID=A0AAN9AXC3_9CAEN
MVAVCFVYLALGMTGIALAQTPCNTSPHHRICAPEASCAQKGCACPEGSIGDPYLLCVPGNQAFCELVGDPHLKTFAGELSPVPIPCMYWATHFYVRKDSDVNKHCKVMVSVVNSPEPVGGQYFVIAAKVIVSIVTGADPSNPTSKTRQTVYYISSDAITKAKVNSKTSAWTLIGTAQSFVDTIYESVTNRAKLTIPSHNVTVTFTPIDTTQTVQTRLSGLVLATPNTTVWLNADFPNTLCSSIWAKDTIRERKREWNQTAGHVAVYGVLVQQLEDPIP